MPFVVPVVMMRHLRKRQEPVWKSKFYGAFVLNCRIVLHAIDVTPARWRGDAGSSQLDRAMTAASSPRNDRVKNCRVHPTHWLISTQPLASLDITLTQGNVKLHASHQRFGSAIVVLGRLVR